MLINIMTNVNIMTEINDVKRLFQQKQAFILYFWSVKNEHLIKGTDFGKKKIILYKIIFI